MITLLRSRKHRIIIAIALSALLHGLILWLPHIKLPRYAEQLPPLMAKLEPLPKLTPPPPQKRKHKPKPKVANVPVLSNNIPDRQAANSLASTETIAASAPETTDTTTELTSPLPIARQTLFPQHAQLIFSVLTGSDGFHIGEIVHSLDIIGERYTVKAATRTTGLVRWFKSYNLNQSSYGTVTTKGLRPETFSEEKNDSDTFETSSATFVWDAHLLYFSQGGESPLNEGAQDSLSILYQLALLPLSAATLPVSISNGKKLENYMLEIAANENLSTILGELHTVHLRKMRKPGKTGLEIWLSREHRLLPVKIQYIEPDGSVAATFTITDIRVSDK